MTLGAASSCLLYEAALRKHFRMDSSIVMVLIAFCTGVSVQLVEMENVFT